MIQAINLVAVRDRESRNLIKTISSYVWVAYNATLLVIAYLSCNYIRDG